jgi:ammonium transporter, Amt family
VKFELRTPALAFFYGGLVESKNIINQLFLSFICMAIVTVQWCLFGFSFCFGPGNSGFGSFQFGALNFRSTTTNLFGLEPDTVNAPTIPLLTFTCYEAAFAVITPALISGGVVGRMKLLPYMLFVFLWTTVCYDPLCRWIFSPLGLLDCFFLIRRYLIYNLHIWVEGKKYHLRIRKSKYSTHQREGSCHSGGTVIQIP